MDLGEVKRVKNTVCVLPWLMIHPSTKFHENYASRFSAILLKTNTDKQAALNTSMAEIIIY